jgi:hypothetical protein
LKAHLNFLIKTFKKELLKKIIEKLQKAPEKALHPLNFFLLTEHKFPYKNTGQSFTKRTYHQIIRKNRMKNLSKKLKEIEMSRKSSGRLTTQKNY